MTVLATEAAGGGSAAGGAAAGAAAGGSGGQAVQLGQKSSKGVLLAIAIILLWLAGLCFFIAFEGSQLLSEASSPTGGGFLKAMITGLADKALKQQQNQKGG